MNRPIVFLNELNGKKVDGYRLHLGELKQLRLSGWKGFTLHVQDPQDFLGEPPVIKGIYSAGGKDGVKSWMDVEYHEEIALIREKGLKRSLNLSLHGLDRKLFRYLGETIPRGGHLMVSYEGHQKIHLLTIKSLDRGVPAAATPLGILLFQAGFQIVKNWYLSEGGHEGPRKLWAEKAPDERWALAFYRKTSQEIHRFLDKNHDPSHRELIEKSTQHAEEILDSIEKYSSGSP
jgi:hypothetical protein